MALFILLNYNKKLTTFAKLSNSIKNDKKTYKILKKKKVKMDNKFHNIWYNISSLRHDNSNKLQK